MGERATGGPGKALGRAPTPWGSSARVVIRSPLLSRLAAPALGVMVAGVLWLTWGDGKEFRGIGFLFVCAVLTVIELRTKAIVSPDRVRIDHSFRTFEVEAAAIVAVVPSVRGKWGRLVLAPGTSVQSGTMLDLLGRPQPTAMEHILLTTLPVAAVAAALGLPVGEPSDLPEAP